MSSELDEESSASMSKDDSLEIGRLTFKKPKDVLTPQMVIAVGYDKLTEYERREIFNYKYIYYYGESAARKPYSFQARSTYNYELYDHIDYRYEIWKLVGKGSYGITISAYDHKEKEFVVIKILRKCRLSNFHKNKEVKILKRIQQSDEFSMSCLVEMKRYFEFRGASFIVLESLSSDLFRVLKARHFKGFSPDVAKLLIYNLVKGVYALHELDIVHCDLKPDNVMLLHGNEDTSTVKIIDFGLSRFTSELDSSVVQTLYYIAPECMLRGYITPAVDMWSVGCISAEMIFGRPLFMGKNEYDQFTLYMEMRGIPSHDSLAALKPTKLSKFLNSSGVPTYCDYVQDQLGSMKLVPRSNNRVIRGIPGSRDIRAVLNDTTDDDFIDFVERCLDWNPVSRLTAEDALKHPYLNNAHVGSSSLTTSQIYDVAWRYRD